MWCFSIRGPKVYRRGVWGSYTRLKIEKELQKLTPLLLPPKNGFQNVHTMRAVFRMQKEHTSTLCTKIHILSSRALFCSLCSTVSRMLFQSQECA